ncbi:hypothetical protein QN277_025740 [Acacia crassicarpa]|uniref:Uncharacterized protein n=1 Tax=Acacia crassicarpa TaxID=499986 RepID=A0AAE1J657_9FABA|nr:hypothetical protein QN277_025740 [Acacia crassicarpa]
MNGKLSEQAAKSYLYDNDVAGEAWLVGFSMLWGSIIKNICPLAHGYAFRKGGVMINPRLSLDSLGAHVCQIVNISWKLGHSSSISLCGCRALPLDRFIRCLP